MVIHKVQKLRKYSMAVQVLGKQSSLERRRTRLLGGNSDSVVLGMFSVQIWAGEHDLGVHLLFVLCSLLLSLNNTVSLKNSIHLGVSFPDIALLSISQHFFLLKKSVNHENAMEQDLTKPSQDRPSSCPPPASVCRKTQLKNKFDHRNEKKKSETQENSQIRQKNNSLALNKFKDIQFLLMGYR